MRLITAMLSAAMLAMPLSAQAFTGERGNPVVDIGDATFEVVARGGTGPKTYWCAAAGYAWLNGLSSSDRVYLVRSPGPSEAIPGRTAAQFTTDPNAAGLTPLEPQSGLSVSTPGDNLSLIQARQYCTQGLRRS